MEDSQIYELWSTQHAHAETSTENRTKFPLPVICNGLYLLLFASPFITIWLL